LSGLSRREFLGGAAGVTAAIVAPPLSARPAAGAPRSRAAITPLAGATVSPGAYHVSDNVQAAKIFDGYVGLPLGTTLQKIYLGHGSFPEPPPSKLTSLAKAGCQFLISVEPDLKMTSSEQNRLKSWLALLTSMAISYRVVLYSEANNLAFATQAEWLAYWDFYAPVIKDAGVACCYDPGCNSKSLLRAESYFPVDPAPDELWMDFYGTSFRAGTRIDNLIAQARSAGISAGLAEWGWHAGNGTYPPMTLPWWNAYCAYLVNLAGQGSLSLGGVYFDASGNSSTTIDIISSSSDPRIPGIQSVSGAVQGS
jgi:hypothetical protein